MKKLLLVLILFNLTINSHVYSIEADVFVQSTVNRASQILSKNISKEQKIKELKSIAKETVDIRGVGFYSLGAARKGLNEGQKKEYLELFENYFLKSLYLQDRENKIKNNQRGNIEVLYQDEEDWEEIDNK